MTANRAASIHARLLNVARSTGDDFNRLLNRYAVERWLYRLSGSELREQFCLKGAQLFVIWLGDLPRPTRDADFLARGSWTPETLRASVQSVCGIAVDDGVAFDVASVTVEEIREDASYGGLRARFQGRLGNARLSVQLDFGFGDVVTPEAQVAQYPTVFADLPAPHLVIYPRETAFAEKLEAMAQYGMANSRMKDYFDLYTLVEEGALDAGTLAAAIAATFARRGTSLPDGLPTGLTQEFASDAAKRAQWRAFLGKSGVSAPSLDDVVERIAGFTGASLAAARAIQTNT